MADMAKGAAAGLVGAWAMEKVTQAIYDRQGEDSRRREMDARRQRFTTELVVEKMAKLAGKQLEEDRVRRLGRLVHYAVGVGVGGVYGAMRGRIPAADAGQGSAFGVAFFAVGDEGLMPALTGLPGPRAFPWQTHARGLVGHVVFGVATETTLDAMDAVATRGGSSR